MFTGSTTSESNSATMPAHLVVDVAERARLRAVAVDRERLAVDRLREEVRDDAAVGRPQPRAVRVEDAHDRGVEVVEPVVRHRQRLGEALRFVVHRARPGRVDVAVVVLASAGARAGRRRSRSSTRGGTARRVARARSSARRVPSEPTSSVSSGISRYSGGLAGLAKCSTPSTAPRDRDLVADVGDDQLEPGARARARRCSRAGRCTGCRPRRPRRRARATPRQRCEPRNPAPPVTTMRLIAGPRRRRRTRCRRIAAGSSRLRASTTLGRRIASRTRSKSSQRNSSHSVSTATTSAPCAASYASAQISSCGTSAPACSPAAGSNARTSRRPRHSRRAIAIDGESRRSSVSALNVRPQTRDHRAFERAAGRGARSCRRCARAARGSPRPRRRASSKS